MKGSTLVAEYLWVNPKYAQTIAEYDQPIVVDGNCGNCHGTGRIIYTDSNGKMKDVPCPQCQGSGQTG